ncbi:Glycerol-3-phosphate dehydrogenase, mitochondrial [Hondaea fermentalgiana]|uniref:Glycerol-3-phosphate dehydrogenase n=1 Tax=Hondaea fermentalgiana TaxID=2315210 RepID=A0A2R5GA04_9STRA|nr:Glycerol-3-phosphate dehydrogenase, mitochondrial [Hondaea fermentalgiana]|eukprot:GBG27847.1 Glycerol-3-phosphate dehydrogenase, mitochondrial [Hondaea fermentalgiana]
MQSLRRAAKPAGAVAAAATLAAAAIAFTETSNGDKSDKVVKCQAFPLTRKVRESNLTKTLPIACRDGTMVFPWSPPSREEQLKELETEKYDLLVIGGGCVGSGVALDAATRGLRVAVVEREDFSSGTSSRSTKLIHGGVRYLENAFLKLDYGQYLLVKEALEERSHMLQAAPFIAKPLPIMVPIEEWWKVPYYFAGTKVYDMVAGKNSGVPSSMFLTKQQALYNFPMLDPSKIAGAIVYYDGQMDDARYGLLILLTAIQAGATAVNYMNADKLLKDEDGKLCGARVRDRQTGKIIDVRATAVVNATGPFSDAVRHMANDPNGEDNGPSTEKAEQDIIVPAGGIHVTLSDDFSPSQMGLIVPNTSDGRVLFFLPWSGGTIVGTTDSATPLTMRPKPSLAEVDFVLAECGRYLNRRVSHDDVRAAWSGIRPLVRDVNAKDTKAISREHVVEVSKSGLITIGGGKWTTQRRMAQDAVDRVLKEHPRMGGKAGPCATLGLKLIGADRAGIICDQKYDIVTVTLREDYGFDRDIAQHLVSSYGTRALQIAEIIKHGYPTRAKGLHPKRLVAKHPVLEAEVAFAVKHEYAVTAVDVLARRTRLAFVDHDAAVEAVPQVVKLMGTMLGWSRTKCTEETEAALTFLETMKLPEE